MSSQQSTTTLEYKALFRCKREAVTEADKELEKKIFNISKQVLDKCNNKVDSDELNQTIIESHRSNHTTILSIDRDIFGWSFVRSDFEHFSTFLPLLKQSNTFLDSIGQLDRACTEHRMRFKSLWWSLFSGFEHKSSEESSNNSSRTPDLQDQDLLEESSDNCSRTPELQDRDLLKESSDNPSHTPRTLDENKSRAIKYYRSILELCEQDDYRRGTFVERFRLLAKITQICPVRLDLLNPLHEQLANGEEGDSLPTTQMYRLFATIIIDRHGTKYCRLRIRAVNKEFDTSRLTRLYGEESFLRVSLVPTFKSIDVAWCLAPFGDPLDNKRFDLEDNSVVHNISILIHMMRDLCKATSSFSEKIAKTESELKQENVDRMNKDLWRQLTAQWSTSGFDPLEEQAFLQWYLLSLTDRHSLASNCISVSSLKIAGRCFEYSMTTSSGVHKNMHIFSIVKYDALCKQMFSDRFLQKHIDYELKLSLRMGLWFTPSISANLNLKEEEVETRDDIDNHTDGCGCVSMSLAKEMSTKWKEGRKCKNDPFVAQNVGPTEWNAGVLQDSEIEYDDTNEQPEYYSAFQVRLDGFKGMLVVDHSLGTEKRIATSRSQEKFVSTEIDSKSRYATIEIVQCSQPMSGARLNFALISLIVACAKDPKIMQTYIASLADDEIKKLLDKSNRSFTIGFALKHNDVKSFNMLGAGCSLFDTFLAGYYQNYARRFKVVVEKSRRLFGVADFWQVLKEGEVFVKISNLRSNASSGPSVIEQNVLVTKEPCFHRRDLRTFIAVTEKELEQRENGKCLVDLQDVIVFSCCRGKRAEPDKICGSDLDGDQYFVCWDENILENLRDPLFEPGVFNSISKENLNRLYKGDVEFTAKKEMERQRKQEIERRRKELGLMKKAIEWRKTFIKRMGKKAKVKKKIIDQMKKEMKLRKKIIKWAKIERIEKEVKRTEKMIKWRKEELKLLENEIERKKKESEGEENENGNMLSEIINLESEHSKEEEEWMRYHVYYDEFFSDMEDEIHRLKSNSLDTKTKEDTHRKGQNYSFDMERIRCNAASAAMNIAGSSCFLTIHDLFDLHMRIIDNLKHEWTTDENWQVMKTLCRVISMVLDSSKSAVMTYKKALVEDLPSIFDQLPKYPHFHPSKRKDECKRSDSALGQIYDSLRKELEKHLNGQSPSSETASNTSEMYADTLYDEISQMKLSFLFHHANNQCYSDAPASVTPPVRITTSSYFSDENPHTGNSFHDAPLQSVAPHVNIKKISEWYEKEIASLANSNLLKKEAACTMLWKLITFLDLKNNFSCKLRVLYLGDGESLSDVKLEYVVHDDGSNFPFFCITESLFKDLKQISPESFSIPTVPSKTFFLLEQSDALKLIKLLGALVARNFWKDLKLPYPDCVRRARVLNTQSESKAITFNDMQALFEEQTRKCLQKPVFTDVHECRIDNRHFRSCDPDILKIGIGEADKSPHGLLSKLCDIAGCLLCLSETWKPSQEDFLFTIGEN